MFKKQKELFQKEREARKRQKGQVSQEYIDACKNAETICINNVNRIYENAINTGSFAAGVAGAALGYGIGFLAGILMSRNVNVGRMAAAGGAVFGGGLASYQTNRVNEAFRRQRDKAIENCNKEFAKCIEEKMEPMDVPLEEREPVPG